MGKPHEQRKSEIIQSTLALAAELGVKKVTTQAIADHVGVAQATIFRHFKTRDAIFSDAIEWLAGRLFKQLTGCFSSDLPADEQLQCLVVKQLGFISEHKGLPRLLFSDRLHMESPVLKLAVQKIMNRYTKQVTKLIQEGMDSGVFRDDLDAKKSALLLAAVMQGLVIRWSIFNFNFNLEQQADDVWDFIFHSLKKG